jgi:hypothetical protein
LIVDNLFPADANHWCFSFISPGVAMARIIVQDYHFPTGWNSSERHEERSRYYCEQLELGGILYFDKTPFDFSSDDIEFLLGQKQSDFKGHKNISYRPQSDVLRGAAAELPELSERLQSIMRNYSKNVTGFLEQFLMPYAGKWKMDFASFRPIEEQNRDLPLKRRNDLMHVDAFPTRPTHGGRILRVFTNINPARARVWRVSEPFTAIAEKYAKDAGLQSLTAPTLGRSVVHTLSPLLKAVGVKGADRSPYDRFMLHFHDYLKENNDYQKNFPAEQIEFPPGATWMCYTCTLPHAVLSGQYALEQTYIIPVEAMVSPAHAPIHVLEGMVGHSLAH